MQVFPSQPLPSSSFDWKQQKLSSISCGLHLSVRNITASFWLCLLKTSQLPAEVPLSGTSVTLSFCFCLFRNVQSSVSSSRKRCVSASWKSSARPARSVWAGCSWTRRCCRCGWRRRTTTVTTWTCWCDTSESISAPSTPALSPPSRHHAACP